ncbi:uncharacterized protein LOC110103102 isoform X1 [Dendrobium catenatum]|uniref:uncharacterized protein LOC110103102 isoform X1 n=1 Tax=Dendrobium catenatum TaxID=906689 RepID=UPI0009F34686|nr:uncharacterized protein LOC110103102 isoform X1 [Dendrobium catenatum]
MESMNIDDGLGARHPAEGSEPLPVATAAGCEAEQFPVPAGCENGWPLLDLARQLVTQGKPSLALQAVVMAIKSAGGDQAVRQTLLRAQELYINRVRADAAADELASVFAECAIAEAQPPNPVLPPPLEQINATNPTLLQDASDTSILAQSGRMQIMLDAFADGSSFVCLKCGGLVSNHRKDEHFMYWCG